jgi:ADP-ribose pyrophosphatase YjhB (NUDIX family)
MAADGRYATAVVIEGPGKKIPLVLNPNKPLPHFWKFPGGRSERGEIPEETAIREIAEETGLTLNRVAELATMDRGDHMLHLFGAKIPSFDGLAQTGIDGEQVALFSYEEIIAMVDFFGPHRELLDGICQRA